VTSTKLLVDTGASVSGHVSTSGAAEADAWLRGGPTRASIRKELLYLLRSPARRSATLVAIALGTGFVLLQVLQRGGTPAAGAVLAAPLAGFFAVSAVNNQLGHDGASLWIEIVAGGPRPAGFVGREVSWIPAIVLPCVPAAVILAALSGGWRYLPFAIALSFAVAGIPLGVGASIAVFAPIAIADDANPFTNRSANTGQGCVVGLMAVVALLVDGLLLAPVIAAVAATHDHLGGLAVVIAATACYAGLVWAAGVALATRRVRGREPELWAALSPRV
jgi:hypothetical protein